MTPLETEALWLSLRVSLWSVVLSLPFAIAIAWALARKSFRGKLLLDGLVHLPLVLPPVVVGYLLLLVFGRSGALGTWLHEIGLDIAFTWKGAAIAASVMGFPLMVRAIRLAFEAVDPRLEQAARTLGAGRFRVFLTVTLPLARPGLVAGVLLGFARSLGEFGATITFVASVPGETRTLPVALYSAINTPGAQGVAVRLLVLSLALAFAALFVSEIVARRMRREVD